MWKIPVCDICFKEYPIQIMIKDELWKKVRLPHLPKGGVFCASCIEAKLGRKLTLADLHPCGITDIMLLGAAIAQGDNLPSFGRES